jgi:putative N6-adenine-specific DNA methylase
VKQPREQQRRAERNDAAATTTRKSCLRRLPNGKTVSAAAQENAPRKLFSKPAERREDSAPRERFQRETARAVMPARNVAGNASAATPGQPEALRQQTPHGA